MSSVLKLTHPQEAESEPADQFSVVCSAENDHEAFTGPFDVLISLVRAQSIDLAQLSVTRLADQYVDWLNCRPPGEHDIIRATSYLAMAAWLVWLKSRLLAGADHEADDHAEGDREAPCSASALAERFKAQLQNLIILRESIDQLLDTPRRGVDFFTRPPQADDENGRRVEFKDELHNLLSAYGALRTRAETGSLRIIDTRLFDWQEQIERIALRLNQSWQEFDAVLPAVCAAQEDELIRRSAIASSFAAVLELARCRRLELKQEALSAPLYVRAVAPAPETPSLNLPKPETSSLKLRA